MRILGARVDHVNMEQALENAKEGMNHPPFVIVTPNSEIIVQANKNPKFMEIIENAGMVVPDGIGLVIASKIVGQPLTERVTGVDLMERLLEHASTSGSRIFFFGGKPGIADMAAEKTREKYKNINIVGTHHGYFKGLHTGNPGSEEEQQVIKDIKDLEVDMLFVALGAPNQEFFIDRYKDELGARLLMGVGGSLDVLSETVKRAPEFWIKYNLEWLYRILDDPKARLKRSLALPVFAINVLIKKDKPMKK